ncbi:hypothetical protein RRG08_022415 [Elysia crispata]|uniref:Uncharacterized protein n=1 Tax=Elysia crispata TaxID=231223 RepID=A0AAE1D957_9GAST|nr:hypothetical protein RRG08_022415 [Elysia crispata]
MIKSFELVPALLDLAVTSGGSVLASLVTKRCSSLSDSSGSSPTHKALLAPSFLAYFVLCSPAEPVPAAAPNKLGRDKHIQHNVIDNGGRARLLAGHVKIVWLFFMFSRLSL